MPLAMFPHFFRSCASTITIYVCVCVCVWTTGIRSPAEANDFPSSLCVQTISEAHLASYPMGNVCRFPEFKRGRSVTLTEHLI
jgi:hypothetical protein